MKMKKVLEHTFVKTAAQVLLIYAVLFFLSVASKSAVSWTANDSMLTMMATKVNGLGMQTVLLSFCICIIMVFVYTRSRNKLLEIRKLYVLAGISYFQTPMFIIALLFLASLPAIIVYQWVDGKDLTGWAETVVPSSLYLSFASIFIFHFIDYFRVNSALDELRKNGVKGALGLTKNIIENRFPEGTAEGFDRGVSKDKKIKLLEILQGHLLNMDWLLDDGKKVQLKNLKKALEQKCSDIDGQIANSVSSRADAQTTTLQKEKDLLNIQIAEIEASLEEADLEAGPGLRSIYGTIANLYHPDYLPHLSYLYLENSQLRALNVPPRRVQLLGRKWTRRGLVSEYVVVHNISDLQRGYIEDCELGRDNEPNDRETGSQTNRIKCSSAEQHFMAMLDKTEKRFIAAKDNKEGLEQQKEQTAIFQSLLELRPTAKWSQRSLKKRCLVTVAPDGTLLQIAIEEERQINV